MTHGPGRPPNVFDRAVLTGIEGVTEIVLVRHGEQYVPDWRGGPVGDIIDPPLSERGEAQARLVGERFSTEKVDAVFASPLKRAFDTGAAIAKHHRMEPVVLPDLREVEIFRDIPPDKAAVDFIGRDLLIGIRERMIREKKWDVYPYSESSAEFRRRTVNAIEGIITTNEGKRVVIACHGGVINSFIGHIIGTPYDMFFQPAHTAVNIVAAGEGIRAVHTLNDTHHLRTSEGDFLSH
jgi:2,3-bisphosphoglycerate-dependent phosphoglycerate mutase